VKATSIRGAFLAYEAEGLQPPAPAGFNCHLGTALPTVGTHLSISLFICLVGTYPPGACHWNLLLLGTTASGTYSFNIASGTYSFNFASGTYSFNFASGTYSFNFASGTHSFNCAIGTHFHLPNLGLVLRLLVIGWCAHAKGDLPGDKF
jgi:hypothetical protein